MRISVGVGCYNFEKYIDECIHCLVNQLLPPEQIVIYDDCSTDNSFEICEWWAKRYPFILAVRNPERLGPAANGNRNAHLLTGDYISLMDGDDRWLPRKLEAEVYAMKRTGYPIAYSNVRIIDELGNFERFWHDPDAEPPPEGDVHEAVLNRRFFSGSNSVFRNELMSREVWETRGKCDESLESYWDWEWRIRTTKVHKVAYSGAALVEYRQHGEGYHLRHNEWQHAKMIKEIRERHK